MAKNFRVAEAAVNAEANAVAPLLDGGYLRIYDGTQPPSADDPPDASVVLLAELRFGSPAFGAAEGGVITAEALEEGAVLTTGTATWFRTVAADGVTAVFDGSIAAEPEDGIVSGRRVPEADLLMPTTSLVRRTIVTASALTFIAGK